MGVCKILILLNFFSLLNSLQCTVTKSQAVRVTESQSFILYAVLARPQHTYFIRISMMQKITKLFAIQCKKKKKTKQKKQKKQQQKEQASRRRRRR